MGYLDHLEDIVREDVMGLREAENSYGGSWKQRGGVGAFMMLARKWDRIEQQVKRVVFHEMSDHDTVEDATPAVMVTPYDIFGHIKFDTRPEGIMDDIHDLRRYLLLVEAEMREQAGHKSNMSMEDIVRGSFPKPDPSSKERVYYYSAKTEEGHNVPIPQNLFWSNPPMAGDTFPSEGKLFVIADVLKDDHFGDEHFVLRVTAAED